VLATRRIAYSAFTLIELLVTIAVIAVLAGSAASAVPSILERVRRVQCQARLAKLGHAVLVCAQDHDMALPGAGQPPTGNPLTSVSYTYTRDILPYLGLTEEQAWRSRLNPRKLAAVLPRQTREGCLIRRAN